ncbi:hypothetical protein HanRHA438_Chr16g0785151 [Helianthus annuus]|nr:hypothetical protein HanRHA438_Chr16g0785151 [Helianthus annuus]
MLCYFLNFRFSSSANQFISFILTSKQKVDGQQAAPSPLSELQTLIYQRQNLAPP